MFYWGGILKKMNSQNHELCKYYLGEKYFDHLKATFPLCGVETNVKVCVGKIFMCKCYEERKVK